MNQQKAGPCPRDGYDTILNKAETEETGYVSPYRLRNCPVCKWQQWERTTPNGSGSQP